MNKETLRKATIKSEMLVAMETCRQLHKAGELDDDLQPISRYMFLKSGPVASWLECSNADRVVRVRVLAGDTVWCSWARHFTLMVPLSTQVYKWVPANLMLGVALRWASIPPGGE